MNDATAQRLLDLNRTFYEQTAAAFARTRARPQPGFERLLPHLPDTPFGMIDLGCGEGRLGRFFFARSRLDRYVGVDGSAALLEVARAQLGDRPVALLRRDLSDPAGLVGLEQADVVACLATLQHIPQEERRAALVGAMGRLLLPGGVLLLSTWQFLDSPRQRRKIRPWAAVGIDDQAVDPGDALLGWQDGSVLRYVRQIDAAEIGRVAAAAGLRVTATFRSDGREGDLNLYAVLRAK